jgi:small GTP-binding protein
MSESRIKVVLLGDAGVGKTAIIRRYYEGKFSEILESTYNASFIEKTVQIEKKKLVLELWDTVGQEAYRSLTKIFTKNSKIIILVYDVTSMETFNSLNYWYDYISKEAEGNVILGVAGNKTDLILEEGHKEEVSQEEGKNFAEKINASFALISAKESDQEIKKLFNELISRYLGVKNFNLQSKDTIKINNNSNNDENNKSKCCSSKK